MTLQEQVEQFEKETFPDYTVPDGDLVVDDETAAPFRALLRAFVEECCEVFEEYLYEDHPAIDAIRRRFEWLGE